MRSDGGCVSEVSCSKVSSTHDKGLISEFLIKASGKQRQVPAKETVAALWLMQGNEMVRERLTYIIKVATRFPVFSLKTGLEGDWMIRKLIHP